ncbi:60S ribosomal protein L8 [Spraguea lophii 42_110]|uniref:60S ribosomal protein L8 n=1 Tax=Spraguea lophii (strain 42_110) TaxID=1358809 RepID=S7W736_SPRLO|nr:60S ribosomal protein L8 [Spraguea lophii 42_110]
MGKVIRTLRLQKEHWKRKHHKSKGIVGFPTLKNCEATVEKIVHESGRPAPLAIINYKKEEKNTKGLLVAIEGIYEGQKIQIGENASLELGNVCPIKEIPEGSLVSMVEKKPKDGGKYVKSPGCYATIVYHNKLTNQTTIKLPSGERVRVTGESRALLGIIAGGGKDDKPLLKAVNAYYKYKTKGKPWPRVRGVAMNPVDHPHGGGTINTLVTQPQFLEMHQSMEELVW